MLTTRLTLLWALPLVAACGGSSEAPPAQPTPPPAKAQAPAASPSTVDITSEAALAVLPVADAADGTVDKVVGQCASCSLGMAGDPAHVVHGAGYTFHLCSDSCEQSFVADPEGTLARIAAKTEGH